MLIDATHSEETRVVVVDGNKVEEFDFESENKRQLAGNIYLAKVTRVEPSLQAAFIEYGGNRHGFLAFSEIHPDYYQIPVADREALVAEEQAYAEAQKEWENREADAKEKEGTSSHQIKSPNLQSNDAVLVHDLENIGTSGLETIDFEKDGEEQNVALGSGKSENVKRKKVSASHGVDNTLVNEDEIISEMSSVIVNEKKNTSNIKASEVKFDIGDAILTEEHGIKSKDAAYKDVNIENVADLDDELDLSQIRQPRPRRYKIQEVIKMRQILLVQVVKEERGNKGAALTTYLSLAGRYCVLMPNTARGGGISRKITNAADRKKLKEIASGIDVPNGAGLIIRTAGAKRTKIEVKRDYEYLQRLWEQIRELTLKSSAPSKIYEEGDLIKRSIRDLYNREIDEVLVEGDRGYRIAKDFMKMIMPSHAKNVKIYQYQLPLFARYQVESYLALMFNPVVQLKSGGYIVIGVTEALVAIDVNSGRATKEGSIEETALKTNLEAADEVARQLRLRDLAGLIVIDFIDMDERRNNNSVEKRIKDRLKTDRARIQVGRISGFGLLEMSRQRLRRGMLEATTQACPHCHGTGLIRSEDSLALAILRQIEEEGVRKRSREVIIKCPVSVANFLMNQKREHVVQIEERYALSVRIEGVISLISPEYEIEKSKQASRSISTTLENVVSVDDKAIDPNLVKDEFDVNETPENEQPLDNDETRNKKRRRRRRRRRSKGEANEDKNNALDTSDVMSNEKSSYALDVEGQSAQEEFIENPVQLVENDKPEQDIFEGETKKNKIGRGSTSAKDKVQKNEISKNATVSLSAIEDTSKVDVKELDTVPVIEEKPKKAKRKLASKKPKSAAEKEKSKVTVETSKSNEDKTLIEKANEELVANKEMVNTKGLRESSNAAAGVEEKPRRRGWWSRGEK